MKTTVLAFLMSLAVVTAARADKVGCETVLTNSSFWTSAPDPASPLFRTGGFRWGSERHESLRSSSSNITFAGVPVVETTLWMKAGKPGEAALSIYNRGDCPPMGETAFLELLRSTQKAIASLPQAEASAAGVSGAGGFPPKRQVWKIRDIALVMEWDSTIKSGAEHFQAEFLRLRIMPGGAVGPGSADRQVSVFTAAKKIVTVSTNGDCYLGDVPMVDQGPKGYCAVAATERVLRYYGAAFDQHQLAQIAGTEAGTDPSKLAGALQRSSTKLRIAVDVMEECDGSSFMQLVKAYNSAARRLDKAELNLTPQEGNVIDVGLIYEQMESGVLVDARTRNPTGVNRFAERIKQNIQARTPLVWGVMLGLVPEPDIPQARGGHLRLIIGYNEKAKELLYTDSWGAGHELKRMSLANAYAITTSLFTIKPK